MPTWYNFRILVVVIIIVKLFVIGCIYCYRVQRIQRLTQQQRIIIAQPCPAGGASAYPAAPYNVRVFIWLATCYNPIQFYITTLSSTRVCVLNLPKTCLEITKSAKCLYLPVYYKTTIFWWLETILSVEADIICGHILFTRVSNTCVQYWSHIRLWQWAFDPILGNIWLF